MSDKLTELLVELKTATAALDDAEKEEQMARNQATDIRNRVNGIQKAIDAEVLKMREGAKWNTEWHQQRSMERAVRVAG